MRPFLAFLSFPFLMLNTGCGGDAGTGTVVVTAWGEDYIEEGIPVAEFADGWSASFDTFLIVLGDVTFSNADGGQASMSGLTLYDLATPGPHAMGRSEPLEATNWQSVGYRMAVATPDADVHASATEGTLTTMLDGGYSVYVEGSATNGTDTYACRWGFTDSVRFDDCVDVGGGQETRGVVVTAGGAVEMQLTIHGDHFFYDDLQSGDAALRFENIAAADTDTDGEVTLAELALVPLASLPADNGPYGVGAADANDLGAYMRSAVVALGHLNGEGHCRVTVE